MEAIIYLVKWYIRWYDDKTPTKDMRKRADVLWATETREEAAQDVRKAIKKDKQVSCDLYKKYWFIQEVGIFKALSND